METNPQTPEHDFQRLAALIARAAEKMHDSKPLPILKTWPEDGYSDGLYLHEGKVWYEICLSGTWTVYDQSGEQHVQALDHNGLARRLERFSSQPDDISSLIATVHSLLGSVQLGFDFDGVLADSTWLKTEAALERWGKRISPETFHWHTIVPTGVLSDEEYRQNQRDVHWNEERSRRMFPVGEMLIYLPQLIAQGHDIRVVTGRDGLSRDLAERWLHDHGIFIPVHGMGSRKSKRPKCEGLALFVDDDWDTFEPLVDAVAHRRVYTQPYNEHLAFPETVATRIGSWREIYNLAQEISAAEHRRWSETIGGEPHER